MKFWCDNTKRPSKYLWWTGFQCNWEGKDDKSCDIMCSVVIRTVQLGICNVANFFLFPFVLL